MQLKHRDDETGTRQMEKLGILQTLLRVWVLCDGPAVLNLFELMSSFEILRKTIDSSLQKNACVYSSFVFTVSRVLPDQGPEVFG